MNPVPDQLATFLIPDWPAPAAVRAAFSTRMGGVSEGPYASLNVGTHVGDVPERVQHNRAWTAQQLGCEPVFLQQVHGWEHVALQPDTPHDTVADVCSSTVPVTHGGRACCIMVADCLPLLLCNRQGTWVGAAHAGWRGLLGNVQGFGAIEALELAARTQGATDLIAWIGPCIGPQAFEVGAQVRTAFVQQAQQCAAFQGIAAPVEVAFTPAASPDKWMGNLPLLARLRLQALGISQVYGNDGSPAWCTASQPDRFFSHRRDGVSGRQAAFVWLI
ncbi:laccase domain-containing protein [Curvibacter sp. CHRR-16]|uniref:polyphenol oxidase family protein n=1 Tax=Curvibacter sp. CHRR-16 TaxID=2835872 RepID=UPI001BDAC0D9|nr:laccase domain-containing protein [Curvibacter sp. CHRR-16]MBT0569206.1 laccase domain-containing protein [Curvibacter sp. CHRR-16]